MPPVGRRLVGALVPLVLLLLLGGGAAIAAPTPTPTPTRLEVAPGQGASPGRATFGIQPSSAKAKDNRPYFSFGVTPGATISDHVAVANYSAKPLTLAVYATDAINDDSGGFSLLPAAQQPRDAGRWIATGTPGGSGRVTIPPGSKAIVPFRLTIPTTATPGDHVAGVVASLAVITKNKGVNVRLDQRVAARVYVRVSGPLKPMLVIDQVKVSYHNGLVKGRAEISYRVRNTGNVKLGGDPSVVVKGLLGATAKATSLPQVQLLLPGSSVVQHATVRGVLSELIESAKVTVVPLVVPGDADPGLHKTYSGSGHFLAIPWILVIVVLLVLASLLWRRRRSRKAPESPAGQPAHAVSVGRSA